jgi:DNA repair protein RadC
MVEKNDNKPSYLGHRKRVKAKYKNSGLDGMLDYEILELLLIFSQPRKDTKPIARDLLNRFKTINSVLDADLDELMTVNGISEHTALMIKLYKDIAIFYLERGLYQKDLLSSPQAVFQYLKASLKGSKDEEFKVLFLDNANQLLAIETLHTGTVNKSAIYPRKLVERALHHHANGIIVAHNHPSGKLQPSKNDGAITKMIKEALQTVEIALLDHVIIGGNNYYSFHEKGLL